MASPWPRSWLILFFLFWGYIAICSAADARQYWQWTDDVSCRPKRDALTDSWDEFRALAVEGYYALSGRLSTKTKNMMNSMYRPSSSQIDDIESNHKKIRNLGKDGKQMPYNLYCDDSAMVHVTKVQSGPDKGKPLAPKDRFIYFTRNPPGQEIKFYFSNPLGPCYDDEGNARDAFSLESQRTVVLCPSVWTKPTDRLCDENAKMAWGTSIQEMTTIGSVLYHELTHLRLGTDDDAYGFLDCRALARSNPAKAQRNANSMMYFAIGVFYTKNDWSSGWADRPLPAGY